MSLDGAGGDAQYLLSSIKVLENSILFVVIRHELVLHITVVKKLENEAIFI